MFYFKLFNSLSVAIDDRVKYGYWKVKTDKGLWECKDLNGYYDIYWSTDSDMIIIMNINAI